MYLLNKVGHFMTHHLLSQVIIVFIILIIPSTCLTNSETFIKIEFKKSVK